MRGLMAATNGQIMELPITSNFREGLFVLEMFISIWSFVKEWRYKLWKLLTQVTWLVV